MVNFRRRDSPAREQTTLTRVVLRVALSLPAAIAAAALVQFISPNIADSDAFYHLRHAALYRNDGLTLREFPWLTCSVIGKVGADIWYGFHLLLMPFSLINDAALQLKSAGIFITSLFLLLFYFALRRSRIAYSFLWPFLLLFSGPVDTARLSMVRPHVLSMGLMALLLSLLVSGSSWGVFLAALALAFFHLSMFWVALLAALIVGIFKSKIERVWEWRRPAAVVVGLLAGWLLRPNPLGAAKLVYVQTFRLLWEGRELGLALSSEMRPLVLQDVVRFFLPAMAIWLGVAIVVLVLVRKGRNELSASERVLLWSSLALSLFFFGLALFVSMRSTDQWIVFAMIFVAAGTSYLIGPEVSRVLTRETRVMLAPLAAALFVALMIYSVNYYRLLLESCPSPTRFRAAAQWLKGHSRPGEVVFHAQWDLFPELFFWNTQNRYIGGMDPIFEYAESPELFWKAYHLAANQATGNTWGTQEPAGGRQEDTYTVLKRDFGAAYFFIEKARTPALERYLASDPRFSRGFDDGRVAIFALVNE